MKFIRTAAEVEAMAQRNDKGEITYYLVDFQDAKATKIMTAEELSAMGFRKANGNEIGKERKTPVRKKKAESVVNPASVSEFDAGAVDHVEEEPVVTADGTLVDGPSLPPSGPSWPGAENAVVHSYDEMGRPQSRPR